jgi:hypothetical protein
MGCATNEHLARLDLRENMNTPRSLVPPYLVWAKGSTVLSSEFWLYATQLRHQNLAILEKNHNSTLHDYDTKT